MDLVMRFIGWLVILNTCFPLCQIVGGGDIYDLSLTFRRHQMPFRIMLPRRRALVHYHKGMLPLMFFYVWHIHHMCACFAGMVLVLEEPLGMNTSTVDVSTLTTWGETNPIHVPTNYTVNSTLEVSPFPINKTINNKIIFWWVLNILA